MQGLRQARAALAGVLRLSLFDSAGIDGLDGSWEGCARSFWACVLALPAFVIPLALEFGAGNAPPDTALALSARGLGYVVGCVAFPLAALPLVGWLDRAGCWPKLVFGYNWLGLVQNMAVLVLILADHAGLLGAAAPAVYALFYAFCLAVEGFMFTLVLETGIMAPVALVLFDLVLGELIDGVARSFV